MAQKPRKKNGYKMPDPLPQGEILEDIAKKKWKLGPSIGKGGFGEIYSAQAVSEKNSAKFPYVIKIEPHANGPLFVEMHFYMRNAKPDEVEAFQSSKKLQSFGMPKFIGSGSHEHRNQKYRFLVMEKFSSDIWKLFLENNRRFPAVTVFKLGVQIIDVLEYIHSKGYVHADIKGANILLSATSGSPKQVYLVDFGLASHYSKTLKPDPKKAHNGTIEYTSRDAHLGVQTRRGDLEILAYNLVQWLGCQLPWENISDPVAVQKSKNEHMSNINKFLKTCFGSRMVPDAVEKFLKYVDSLEVDEEPDYFKMRRILLAGVEAEGGTLSSPLEFNSKKATPIKRKIGKNLVKAEEGNDEPNVNQQNGKGINKKARNTGKDSTERKIDRVDNGEGTSSTNEILTSEMKRLKEKLEQKKAGNKKGVRVKNKNTISNGKAEKMEMKQKVEVEPEKMEIDGNESENDVGMTENKCISDYGRSLRKGKRVNYREPSLGNRQSHNSSDIISGSEDESERHITVRKRILKGKK